MTGAGARQTTVRPGPPPRMGTPIWEARRDWNRAMAAFPSRELPPLFLKPIDLDQLMQVLDLQLRGELPAPDAQAERDAI